VIELLRRHQRLVVGAVSVLLPLVVYRTEARREAGLTPLDRLVLLGALPFERALARGVDGASAIVAGYVDLRSAREQAVALTHERDRLSRALAELEGVDAENARLRGLLELVSRAPALDLLPASVVAVGGSVGDPVLRVDKGLGDGVERGMAVVAESGLVGRVIRAGYGFADVQLVTDPKVSLDVVVGRSRVRGRLRGRGLRPRPLLEVEHVLRTEDVKIGDAVLSSGLAGVYPRGVPVGRVARVTPQAAGQELEIEVEPHAELERLESLAIVRGGRGPGEPLATPERLLPRSLRAGEAGSSTAAIAGGLAWPSTTTTATAGLDPEAPR
jgi:rod shape-determining protein MreC